MKLIVKILLAIIAGIVIGLWLPLPVTRILVTFQMLFGQFLAFVIPLLIIFFIVSGIASLSHHAGRMLGLTTLLAYISTLGAGFLACFVAMRFLPLFSTPDTLHLATNELDLALLQFSLPPIMSVTTALVLAFFFGLGLAKFDSPTIKSVSLEGERIVEACISRIIIPLLPFFIAGIFAEMAAKGEMIQTLRTLGFVLLIAVSLHWVWLFVLYITARLLGGQPVFKTLYTMLPAYVTALGTMSSAATIPVTLERSIKAGVSPAVARFAIPLCATIHLAGSTITLVTASVAVLLLQSQVPQWEAMIPFILMLGVTMVAAPGVPGGAVIAATGLLGSMLGFSEPAIGLIIALYFAQDSFGTACNVTGDTAIAFIVDKYGSQHASK